jgi:hypothetical protein
VYCGECVRNHQWICSPTIQELEPGVLYDLADEIAGLTGRFPASHTRGRQCDTCGGRAYALAASSRQRLAASTPPRGLC